MVRFSFRKGLRFLQGTKAFQLIKRLANGNFQLEDEAGSISNLSEAEMHKRWSAGQWQIDEESLSEASNVFFYTTPRDIKSLPEKDQEAVTRMAKYVRGIKSRFDELKSRFLSSPEKLKPKIEEVAKELKDAKPPTPSTVWRWWRKFAATQCPTKLLGGQARSGRRRDAIFKDIFEEAVLEKYLSNQKLPRKEVVDQVKRKIKQLNLSLPEDKRLKAPGRSSVYRWLNELHYQIVASARKGRSMTERELRTVMAGVKVTNILERVELDHTPLDIVVLCKLTRLILGRPWITVAIDRYSRMIVGFYISFHTPSEASVLYTMRMMIMPKDGILERFPDVVGPWPAKGIPDAIVSDNGMELHGGTVDAVSLELGIIFQYCGVAHPEMKGCIERTIGTLNRSLIHTLPGTTFSNPLDRGNYDSEKEAAIDLEVLTHVIVKWIVDDYHKTPHRGLQGRTPLQVWQEAEASTVIELPAFPRQLENIVGVDCERTLFHYGLEYDNLRYNSPLLQTIKVKDGGTPRLRLRGFEHDVGYIAVFHPELKEFIDVPAVNQEYAAGVNRYIHDLVCAVRNQRFGDESTEDHLLLVKAEVQAIVDQAVQSHKKANRKKAAVFNLSDSEQILYPKSEEPFTAARKSVDPRVVPDEPLDSGMDDDLPDYGTSKRVPETA
jgi:putative transposase